MDPISVKSSRGATRALLQVTLSSANEPADTSVFGTPRRCTFCVANRVYMRSWHPRQNKYLAGLFCFAIDLNGRREGISGVGGRRLGGKVVAVTRWQRFGRNCFHRWYKSLHPCCVPLVPNCCG